MTAKQLLNAWMAVFPGPTCREQQDVVEATQAWLAEHAEEAAQAPAELEPEE